MRSGLDVLFISPYLEFPEDTSRRISLLRSGEFLLNAGLLSVASFLHEKGLDVEIIDLTVFDDPLSILEKKIIEKQPRFVGISNQSCYSYLSTIKCANIVKEVNSGIKVVVGGLHVSGIPGLMLREGRAIDFVVVGEGEQAMFNLIDPSYDYKDERFIISGQSLNIDYLPKLNYCLYPDFRSFVPYVEESRGCIAKCEYCISPQIYKGIRIRKPNEVLSDVLSLKKLYGSDDFHFFLEANTFAVDKKKTEELAGLFSGVKSEWRTESRVDVFPVDFLSRLVRGGLRVLDIGLESGAPEILIRMNKTKKPDEYLKKGIKIAEEVARVGDCLLKLNLMFYYGETVETIKQTKKYLYQLNNICPLAVSMGPVRLEPGSAMFQREFGVRDLSQFDDTFWGKTHCYPIDPSPSFSFAQADKICTEIAQEFQTSWTYYLARRYSQLRYDMSYEEFMEEADCISREKKHWVL